MTGHDRTRPLWADLPHGDEITALLDELRTLSPDEARAMSASWRVAGRAVEDAAGAARASNERGAVVAPGAAAGGPPARCSALPSLLLRPPRAGTSGAAVSIRSGE